MRLHVLGCSHHRTPVHLRERLAFDSNQARSALRQLRGEFPGTEAVLLSTCNRVELYTANDKGEGPPPPKLLHFVARFHGLQTPELRELLAQREGCQAARHLFGVTSSLDSMVLGEPQIASQVKAAYELARDQAATGPITHAAFQSAFRTARRVASETNIHRYRVSIPSVAVADFGKRVFERFDNKNVLLIGAGAMAAETLEHLCAEGARQISVINRSISRARELARQWHGEAYPWSQLHEQIAKADLIVSTTSAPEAIMTADDFLALEQMRPQKPLLVLDLAVPRDFDPAIGERPSVYLYSVDDLQAACDANRHRRQQDLPKALQIVENEALQFMSHLNHRAASPVVQCLRQNWQGVKSSEFDRLARKLPELDDKSLQEVSRSFDRLVNKLLHTPLESLRQASQRESPDRLLESIAKLFRLDL